MAEPRHISDIIFDEESLIHFIPKIYLDKKEETDKDSNDDRTNDTDDDDDLDDKEAA